MDNNESRTVYYDKRHVDIVTSGFDAISEILSGSDLIEKESLLLCLDKYLDPWYGYNLPYAEAIFEALQYVVISPNSIYIKEDALHLLTAYSWPPFLILENNLDKVESTLLPDVNYAINMDL